VKLTDPEMRDVVIFLGTFTVLPMFVGWLLDLKEARREKLRAKAEQRRVGKAGRPMRAKR
jgi:hypothetical protein